MTYMLEWQYLIFVLPFCTATLLIVLMGVGALDFGGDADVDHDLDPSFGHDAEAGIHGHADHDAHISHDAGVFGRALSLLGVGRVPLSIVIITFCLVWGFTGFWANQLLENVLWIPFFYAWISISAALFAGVSTTRFVAGVIAKFMPKTETYATRPHDVVGKRGEVSTTVTEKSGIVRVRDTDHNLLDLRSRVAAGQDSIPAGAKVIVLEYDQATGTYLVAIDRLTVVAA